MAKNARDNRPYVKPVTRIELSEKNIKLRWILIAVLLSIAVVSIGMGVNYALNVQPGWNEIQVSSDAPNYSSEFRMMYDFSQTGGDAAAVNKALIEIYSTSMEEAYTLFSKDANVNGVCNLYYLNRHVNETVTVPEVLYNALALLNDYQNRCIFLAPVYVEYNRVFNSESDAQAAIYDPRYNQETKDYIAQLMTFVSDEAAVNLELLENNQVRLAVSDAYLSFAQENGIVEFLDFGWMRNAFVADYAAQALIDSGYTQGYLASFDGFNRSLSAGEPLSFHIYDRQGMDIFVPGTMEYTGPKTIVFLRDYPLTNQDQWNYHVYADGTITSALINPADGSCKSAIPNLVCYSQDAPCAEVLMQMLPVFLTEEFDETKLAVLSEGEVWSVWCREGVVYHNDPGFIFKPMENQDGTLYTVTYAP